MRKKSIYASVCLGLAAAGVLGYALTRPAGPAQQGAAAPHTRAAGGPSLAMANDGPPDRSLPAGAATPDMTAADATGPDRASPASGGPSSGERFPDTPVGRALDKHLLVLVDVSPGADDRKQRSLAELRTHAKEASQALLDTYHRADPADTFGRWLLSLTLWELRTDDGYPGLQEIAHSATPAGLKDNDLEGSALAQESAIRQNAAEGLAALARAGNTAAEADLLSLALRPPSGDDAVRTVAIKGYLAAGNDYAARVQTLKAQLPSRYHDVVTLTVSQPEAAVPPEHQFANPKNGG